MSRPLRAGLVVLIAVFFFIWHGPLLSQTGLVRGFNSDAAIIALMGKKMLEGRGFDVFFWGQNYMGPLTSMFIAAAGAFTGGVDPLALRIGVMAEVLLGILLTGWAVSLVDRRAAIVTMVALAITPPVILRMLITPLGAEMAFVFAAALVVAFLRRVHPLLFGLLAGIGWWMNQQVVFTLLAIGIVVAYRSGFVRGFEWRRIPGIVQALVLVLTIAGALLVVTFVIRDVAGLGPIPFILGPATDALLLLLVPPIALVLIFGRWRFAPLASLAPLGLFAAGFAIGYAPVWLGRVLGWYDQTYVFGFELQYPSGILGQIGAFGQTGAPWIGVAPGAIGVLFAVVFCASLLAGIRHARSEGRVLLALIPLLNVAFLVVTSAVKGHYLISSVGMLFGVAALGAVRLWHRSRVFVVIGAAIALLSMGASARLMHRNLLSEPDPLPLLATVRANQCAVTYADFWIAYRYRLLDEERGAWIPYLSQNRTRAESLAMQRLPGQRCLVANDGTVTRIPHDLPLTHRPPRTR